MEEQFFTGYCRMLDSSRTVVAEVEARQLMEVDCCYGNCVYQADCPIGKQLDALTKE